VFEPPLPRIPPTPRSSKASSGTHRGRAHILRNVGLASVLTVGAIAVGSAGAAPPTVATCNGQAATQIGTTGSDILVGSAGVDVLAGDAGDDVIIGLEGDDVLCGGDGDDVILGGDGNDWIDGGIGTDRAFGEDGKIDSCGNSETVTTCETTWSTPQPTSTTTPSTVRPNGEKFVTVAPGQALPTGDECRSRIRPAVEARSGNRTFNNTIGTASNARFPRVDGNFVGTTDEIIQWTACK